MKITVAVMLVGMFFVVGVSAQVKKLGRVEFERVMNAGFAAAGKRERREVTKSVTFESGKSVHTSTMTEEFLPPSRQRWLSVDDIVGNKSSAEWIVIDGQRYSKNESGKWFKDEPLPKIIRVEASAEQNVVDDKKTKYTSRASTLAGKPVTMYKRVYTAAPDEDTQSSTFILYVDRSGLILKREQNEVERGKGNYSNAATTYQYDPKGLKIEAPAM